MISTVFNAVAQALLKVAGWTHLTYNEINIIVYYLIIPMSWCIMLDMIFHISVFATLWTVLWIYIFFSKRKILRQWCDMAFKLSQKFLLSFEKIGWDYWKASVIICVVLPLLIYVILFLFL